MELTAIARRFDNVPMVDSYNGKKLRAKCQVTTWDNPRRDGLTTLRRVISVAEGTKFPVRGAVRFAGQDWILGHRHYPDGWGKLTIREGYIAQMAYLGSVGTVEQVFADTTTPTYLSRVWVKDVKDISTDSLGQGQYYIYFTTAENIVEGTFILFEDRWHITRNIVSGVSGHMIAEVNELDRDCITTVEVVTKGQRNPVTEKYEEVVEKVSAIYMMWKDDYSYKLPSHEKEQVGDIRLRIKSEDADKFNNNARVKFKGEDWSVTTNDKRPDGTWSVTIRRA